MYEYLFQKVVSILLENVSIQIVVYLNLTSGSEPTTSIVRLSVPSRTKKLRLCQDVCRREKEKCLIQNTY